MKFKNCKKLIAVFLAAALFGASGFTIFPAVFADDGNLALNKPAYTGGDYNSAFSASKAVDGVLGTHWASSGGANNGVPKNTIIIDLEKEYDIDCVNVRSERDMDRGGYSRSGWSVYISTDFNFENAVLISDRNTSLKYGEDLEIELDQAVYGRYVKVTSTTMIVLSEIEVYGELPKKGANNGYNLKSYDDLEADNAAQLVPFLGILEGVSDKEFGPLTLLKRKEAVKSVLSLVNYKASGTEKHFDDVDEDDEYLPYINGALSLGIISNSNSFRPEDYVTVSELYTMILRALGYGEYAAARGEYPLGVLMTASEIKLSSGTGLDGNEYVNRKSALKIFYNALMSSVMENSEISRRGTVFNFGKDNRTVLEKYFNMSMFDGVVTANNASTLNDTAEANPEYIAINNKAYSDLTYSAYNAIGRNICFLVDNDEENEIIGWWENTDENEIYRIECGDLASVSRSSIECFVDGTSKKEYYDITDADVLKNNAAWYDYAFNLDSFKSDDSYILLIDNNSDGTIDVVNIMQPTVIPVDTFSLDGDELTITGKDGVKINAENIDNIDILINGKAGKRRLIGSSAVIYVYLTPNNKNIILDGYNTLAEGTLEAISDKDAIIDGEEYEFSDYYIKNKDKMGKVTVGAASSFVIGKDNKLVWVDDNQGLNSLENLGFILRIGDVENKASARIFNSDSQFVTLEFADKVTIDGIKRSPDYVSENPGALAKKYAIYRVNADNKIKWIDTENYNASSEADSKMYKIAGVSSDTSRSHANAIFDEFKMLFPVKSDMTVFVIPYSKGVIMTSSEYEKYYYTTKYANTFSSAGILLNNDDAFYNQEENGFPLFASRGCRTSDDITTGEYSSCSKYSPVMVVTKINKCLNSDSDTAYNLSGYDFRTGAKLEYSTGGFLKKCINIPRIFEDDVTGYINSTSNQINSVSIDDKYLESIDDIKPGDILKFELVDNMVIGLEKMVIRDVNSEYRFGDEIRFAHATYRYLCGEVTGLDNGLITYRSVNGVEVREYDKFRFCFVYENTKDGKGTVSMISNSDLAERFRSGQRCVVYINGGRPVSIILYP